jgi:hypothetical protein
LVAPVHAEPATATGKGVAGGIMLGAEVVMMPLGIAGVDKWWAYALGGGLGAAAGGVGGYFVETKVAAAEPSFFLLAGGMALVIPTVVVALNATAYKPDVEEGETASEEVGAEVTGTGTDGPSEAPVGAPPQPGGAAPAPAVQPLPGVQPTALPQAKANVKKKQRKPRYLPPSLLGFDFTGHELVVRPGVPAVDIRRTYSEREVAQYGVAQGTSVTFPALTGRF